MRLKGNEDDRLLLSPLSLSRQTEVAQLSIHSMVRFFEHTFAHPREGTEVTRMLVLMDCTSANLRIGRQEQVFCVGRRKSRRSFPMSIVEDLRCISRNIAVMEKPQFESSIRADGTYFVDPRLAVDKLLTNEKVNSKNYRLRGLARRATRRTSARS